MKHAPASAGRAFDRLEEVGERVAGDIVVPQRVAHLFKLVEDHHGRILLELPRLVEDLLDVGLAARRGDDLTGDLAEPVKALLAHLGGENGDAVAPRGAGVEGAAAAVVAGGGPDGVVIVASNWPVTRRGARQPKDAPTLWQPVGNHLPAMAMMRQGTPDRLGGDLDIVRDGLEQAAELLGLVLPGDAEQVQGLTSHRPTFFSFSWIFSGMVSGCCICAMVGMMTLFSLAFWMLCARPVFVDGQINFFFPPVFCSR